MFQAGLTASSKPLRWQPGWLVQETEKTVVVEVAVSVVPNELRDCKPRSHTRYSWQKAPGGTLLPSCLPPSHCPGNVNVSLSNLNLRSQRTILILQEEKWREQRYIQAVCCVHTTFHLSSITILIKGTENLFLLKFNNCFIQNMVKGFPLNKCTHSPEDVV